MKTQEAITKIKRVKGLYAYESDYEALDIAIDALEEKSCESCQEFDCYGCTYKEGKE